MRERAAAEPLGMMRKHTPLLGRLDIGPIGPVIDGPSITLMLFTLRHTNMCVVSSFGLPGVQVWLPPRSMVTPQV